MAVRDWFFGYYYTVLFQLQELQTAEWGKTATRGKTWYKEFKLTYFKALSLNSPEENNETHEKPQSRETEI
jgi:predicted DNA-binding WGR domain protein